VAESREPMESLRRGSLLCLRTVSFVPVREVACGTTRTCWTESDVHLLRSKSGDILPDRYFHSDHLDSHGLHAQPQTTQIPPSTQENPMFLKQAHICSNCEWIGTNSMRCDKCGSVEVMPLGRWFAPVLSITPAFITRVIEETFKSAQTTELKP
jgi:hypothetical protein